MVIDSKYNVFIMSSTWEIVKLPLEKKNICCRWVLKVILKYDHSLERYKVRILAREYLEVVVLDYIETFSPVIKVTIIRIVLSITISYGLII